MNIYQVSSNCDVIIQREREKSSIENEGANLLNKILNIEMSIQSGIKSENY